MNDLNELFNNRLKIINLLTPANYLTINEIKSTYGILLNELLDSIYQKFEINHSVQYALDEIIKELFLIKDKQKIIIKDPEWISVDFALPKEDHRVFGSNGCLNIGIDCFYGHKSCKWGEAIEKGFWDFGEKCWRKTETQEPISEEKKILFWRYFSFLPPNYKFSSLF